MPICAGVNHPVDYQIRVRGRLGQTMRRAFPALHAETRGKDTLLTGAVADQAALFGVLTQVEALGLELVEVRRLPRRRNDKTSSRRSPR